MAVESVPWGTANAWLSAGRYPTLSWTIFAPTAGLRRCRTLPSPTILFSSNKSKDPAMNRLACPITPNEAAAYNVSGVVLLKSVLDLKTVNGLRRYIDEATETLRQNPAGYDLTAITTAAETSDVSSLAAQSSGQYDIAGSVDFIRESGHPHLLDADTASGSFLLDTGVSARNQAFKRFCLSGVLPAIAAAFLQSDKINFLGNQISARCRNDLGRVRTGGRAPPPSLGRTSDARSGPAIRS